MKIIRGVLRLLIVKWESCALGAIKSFSKVDMSRSPSKRYSWVSCKYGNFYPVGPLELREKLDFLHGGVIKFKFKGRDLQIRGQLKIVVLKN